MYLQDIWPSQEEVAREIENALDPEIYKEQYADVYTGNEQWNDVEVPAETSTSGTPTRPTSRSPRSSRTWDPRPKT